MSSRDRTASLLPVALVLVLLSPSPSRAASARVPAEPDTTKPVMFLKETVVTGSRYPRAYYESPQALSFLNRRQIREAVPIVTGDLLDRLPGVDNSKDSPWEQRPVLRGLSGQRVMVLMDGSPMNSMRGNGPHPGLVEPSQIERIEVVRGPSSVSYGSDAIGGAINIVTRQAPPTTAARSLHGGATLGGSSAENLRSGGVELIPQVGRLSAFLSGGERATDDFKAPKRTVKNSAFSDYDWLANARLDLTDRLSLKAGWQQYRATDIGIPGLTTDFPGYHQDFQFPFYNRDYAHVTLEHQYPGSMWLNQTMVQGYYQREFRNFWSTEDLDRSLFTAFGIPPGGPGSAPASAQTRVTNQDRYFDLDTWGFKVQMTSARTEHARFTFGVDGNSDHTDGDNVRFRWYENASGAKVSSPSLQRTASVPDGSFANYAGFLQGEWYASAKATVSAGGRLTHYAYETDAGINQTGHPFAATSVKDDALAGSIGVSYEVVPDTRVTANVATGYREPNAQDLFFSGPASVGFVLGNENLVPEKSLSYDLGLRWGPGPFAVAGNLFFSTYDDLIDAIQLPASKVPAYVPPGQSAYQYVNITNARIWGGDFEAEARAFARWTFRTQFSGQVGDITNRDAILTLYGISADHVPLALIPPFKGSNSARWTDARGRYYVEGVARWSWRTNRLPPSVGVVQFTTFKKEYLVGDVMAGVTIGQQRLTVGVRNFTNRNYRPSLASIEDPGVSFVGSLSTRF